mmetsp:Transcript_11949/g.25217  ORF Transcript_11949/g.25217 Transcript_11949/m.25217 type:complete len:574 (+) Transcript_11949:205-1926(+)
MEQAISISPSNQLNAHIASGCFTADGTEMKITMRRNAPQNIQDDSGTGSVFHDEKYEVDDDDDGVEPITLPESTHSFLFSEPICSLGFLFAAFIVLLSYASLLLALVNNVTHGTADNPLNVPYNVTFDVRISQYFAIVIALIMEEEIPTGLYLLRMIPKQSLHRKFPKIKFYRFFLAAIVRLLMGYLFLTNTFLVVVQAEEVLDIFYDVLALQFLQQLDDISFALAKIDVFGKHLKIASTRKYFRVEFNRVPFGLRKMTSLFLKGLYFLNLAGMLAGLIMVTTNQVTGRYHCDSITVAFGDDIWDDAMVVTDSGEVKSQVLLFSYFNGVYRRGKTTQDGRPVYIEQNKFDSGPFQSTIPAEIRYCASERAWVFSHRNIRKSAKSTGDSCQWLLKSHETTEFNLLQVPSDWIVWKGTLDPRGTFSTMCNRCNEETDCNYHGQCVEGSCACDGEEWFGVRCQHKKPCKRIVGREGAQWILGIVDENTIYRSYDLPLYVYDSGLNSTTAIRQNVTSEDMIALMFSGSRWFGTVQKGKKNETNEYWIEYSRVSIIRHSFSFDPVFCEGIPTALAIYT